MEYFGRELWVIVRLWFVVCRGVMSRPRIAIIIDNPYPVDHGALS